ncbi:acyl-CoA dehydrogenase family protein [Terracoccus luteus]|uniref:Alkylation response protein AidB-like acyl-CoA dehydrogenase n=1 Tax=Terracoccus luteus TaxID=53356 RepID=A0A495XVV3_9MICO|nr:acyl-CoA dehydrogenase family protein [Terracoccus luteus]MBB2986816.1 alkylation response protein AidB-like acyl-CoA dehydrogenase [Terracoccus luteus]MCP2172467.1 alkylation response protein AidB-like acyl-CoA dehydrogenase [Terracoccus luteus]RKT76866.1 alkylation response protein AidB-like acyl-CoA dehydrogenase [Terracoccus luteus]
MPATRLMPTDDADDLIELTREICRKDLAPEVDHAERSHAFPEKAFTTLGRAGLLSLPYPEEFGGAEQPYEVYLQVVEEIATAWMSVAVGVSVHGLTAYPVATFGTRAQQEALLPGMLSGETLGAYCLSEALAGSDIGSMTTRATPTDDGWSLKGTKSWISHAGHADWYTTFARTADTGGRGLSTFVVPADAAGISFGAPERKMGLHCDPVAQVTFENTPVAADHLVGEPGQGMRMALSALDAGRLGIAAAATGLAQCALDAAADYAKQRQQFGRAIATFQGLAFMLADMEAAVTTARATYLHAARLKDAGRPFAKEAAVAKLVATDTAMKVTTDAVQVLGGAGYTEDFPLERYMREAKVTQIFEGTNQIQRLVISRHLLGS